MKCLVAGAGGFIGGHLVRRLLDEGHEVRAVDIKPQRDWPYHGDGPSTQRWWQIHPEASYREDADLRSLGSCNRACRGINEVYNLAADMGGMGYIENHKADCMVSVLINTNLLRAAKAAGVKRYFYSSSACVYHADRQADTTNIAMAEHDAYHNGGAMPEDGYGWEKLFSERMCRHFTEDHKLDTRIARFHNVYGPHGSWNDGREKAPAAICRKVAEAKLSGNPVIDIWGDGKQVRSFMWIADCVEGIRKIMDSDIRCPINLGSSESVTVDELIDVVQEIAGITVGRRYDLTAPQGVRGRSSDNTLIKHELGWEPSTPLLVGLTKLYEWVEQQVKEENH